ncbi:sulfate anion transporter [Mycena olivaceomarginata]|nr:sulfate anion transporter [Mycena olivaceomarginata]
MPREPHLTRPLDPNSSAASTSSLMDIDGVVGGATLIDVERGRDQVPDSDQDPGGTYTKRIKYYVPGTAWIPNYKLSFLGGDVLAGLTVASMLIPQSVSYATSLAQLSADWIVNVAPEAAISLLVGLFAFLLGFFRLGFIDVVLSRALLRGFITAIAVVHPESTFDKVIFLLEYVFTHANITTTIVSFSALAVLVGIRAIKGVFQKYWWIYRLPEVLLVVVFSTFSEEFGWDKDGVEILGAVPITSMKSFVQIPLQAANLKYLRRTTSTSMLIAVVGFLDSIVAAKQNASRFGYTISPNRELVALGASNLVASFVPGTLPAWGSITRSRINGDVGARTQMASLVCSAVVLLATFFLLPWLYYLPKCVLSAIICLVVFSLLREAPHDIAFTGSCAWVDLGLMSLTFFSAIVWNIEIGITLAMIASLLLVVHRSSKTRMTILGRIPGTERWKPINENPEAEEDVSGALIVRIRENLDFANTAQLKERLRRLELYGLNKSHPSEEPRRQQATVLVFHMADVDSCDASAVEMFYELCEEYKVGFVQSKAGIFDLLGDEAFQLNVADAMTRVEGQR